MSPSRPRTPLPPPGPGTPRPRSHPVVAAMSRRALLWAVPVGAGASLLWWVLQGPQEALGALVGAVIAVLAFASGTWGVGRLLDHLPGAEVAGALALYLIQLLLLVSAVLLVREQTWADPRATAVGLLATALAYQVGQVTAFLGARMPTVQTPLPGDPLP